MKISKRKAYTLAETLLTLMIIGVIAAITIPTLKSDAEERKFVSLTQKAFNAISDATARVEAKHGNSEFWDWAGYATGSEAYADEESKVNGGPNLVRSWYKEVMNVDRGVKLPDSWGTEVLKLSGQSAEFSMRVSGTFVTADGMCWEIAGDLGTPHALVDINCDEGPNTAGIDIHAFNITDDGVYPGGVKGTNFAGGGGDVWDCTGYVIKHGKMPWLKKPMDKCPEI